MAANFDEFELSDTGQCLTCQINPMNNEIIECFNCLKNFHALCSTSATPICNKTLLNQFKAKSTRCNFKYMCDRCITRSEQQQPVTDTNRIDKLENKLESFGSQLIEIMQLLHSQKSPPSTLTQTTLPSIPSPPLSRLPSHTSMSRSASPSPTTPHVSPSVSTPAYSEVASRSRNQQPPASISRSVMAANTVGAEQFVSKSPPIDVHTISANSNQFRAKNQQSSVKKVIAENSVIIDHIDNPVRFRNSLTLKLALKSIDAGLVPLIQCAKVINNGKIIIEGKTKAAGTEILSKLDNKIEAGFGSDSSIRQMMELERKKSRAFILRGLPSDYDLTSVQDEILSQYPSLSNIVSLSKPGSTSRFKSARISFSNEDDIPIIRRDGITLGFQKFRAEEWISGSIQCYNCQRFNHTANVCSYDYRCLNCGESHPEALECKQPAKCANCGDGHKANNSACVKIKAHIDNKRIPTPSS